MAEQARIGKLTQRIPGYAITNRHPTRPSAARAQMGSSCRLPTGTRKGD